MSGWWVHQYVEAGLVVVLVSHIFWVIFSITLHELAHGWAAIWQGDDTPIRLQRMTMNPLVHMGGMSLLMFALVGIAWGMMPIDPSRFRWKRRGRIVVAGAGPAMNVLLAVTSIILLVIWLRVGPHSNDVYGKVATFFFVGAELNILLALFNLLPVPPLDGSDILSGLSFGWYRMMHQTNAPMIGAFIVLALMLSGMTIIFWRIGYHGVVALADALGSVLGNPPVQSVIDFGY